MADLEILRRRYTREVLADIAKHPHNVGASEIRDLVALAIDGSEEHARAARRAEVVPVEPDSEPARSAYRRLQERVRADHPEWFS